MLDLNSINFTINSLNIEFISFLNCIVSDNIAIYVQYKSQAIFIEGKIDWRYF